MGFICSARTYKFKGWWFEYGYTSVWPLKKDGEPRKKAGMVFWSIIDNFCKLSDEEQKQYRVGGGCQQF